MDLILVHTWYLGQIIDSHFMIYHVRSRLFGKDISPILLCYVILAAVTDVVVAHVAVGGIRIINLQDLQQYCRSTRFLDWVCTKQTLRNRSQRQVTNLMIYSSRSG